MHFGNPEPELGNARTASLPDGGLVGVRAPLRETEEPIVRPYWLVDDIKAALAAAEKAGFAVADSLHSVRITGDNRPGIGAEMTKKLADAGINLRGLSAAVIGEQFIMYLALDTNEDAEKTMGLL